MKINAKYGPLLDYLKWNASGRVPPLRNPLVKNIELDPTTVCPGLPSCWDNCTYAHSRGLRYTMGLPLAEKILSSAASLGINSILFSGGGEPLVPVKSNFTAILKMAHSKGFECSLMTNGIFLDEGTIPEILPYLKTLRVSIPSIGKGYDHLAVIKHGLEKAVNYRRSKDLGLEIAASVLIYPDTPFDEIDIKIFILDSIGLDTIRFKPAHVRKENGDLHLDISAFNKAVTHLQAHRNPKIRISKIDQLQTKSDEHYDNCYYHDFNPMVAGADGNTYACCEHKYQPDFLIANLKLSDAEEMLDAAGTEPFKVRKGCFAGCKGDLANMMLNRLVEAYAKVGDNIFLDLANRILADNALIYLTRTDPRS